MTLSPLMFAIHIEEDERNLAERLKRREPAAMAELYDRYGKLAYSLIYRVVRDVGVAEDLVQETFLRVWNRAQGFDSELTFILNSTRMLPRISRSNGRGAPHGF